jgi:glycosyltransferase involved in cell wall biosynthesis
MKLSIIVPAYNESDNLTMFIPQLMAALSVLGDAYEVIVVDNASTDDTQQTLRVLSAQFPSLRTVFAGEKGFGAAVLAGLNSSKGDILGYIHADNQMKPDNLIAVYRMLIDKRLSVCKARRKDRHDGAWRWLISNVYNVLFPRMFGVNVRDINGSPKLFTRQFFLDAKLASTDWFIDPEIIIKAKRLGAPVGEVDISTYAREHGSSQVRMRTVVEFLKNMYRYWRETA